MVKIPKRRNGYYYQGDKEYVSITKVLGDTIAKPALYYWSGIQASKIALKDPTLNEKEVMAQLQLNLKGTQERGRYIHRIAELLANAKEIETDEKYEGYTNGLISWWNTHKPEVLKQEGEVYCDELMVAGRFDMVAKIGDYKWVIDFKTGKDIYKEVGLQLAFYKHALSLNNIIEVDKTGVVLLMKDGEFQFKETTDTILEFIPVLSVWKWLKKKEG